MEQHHETDANSVRRAEVRAFFERTIGLAIEDEPKREFYTNLHLITVGLATIEEVGPPFFRSDGGGLVIKVKGTPWEPLYHAISEAIPEE